MTVLVRAILVLGHSLRIYPASHKVVEGHLQALACVLDRCLAGRREPLRIQLHDKSLRIDGRPPQRSAAKVALLARALSARGLEEIRIHPGVQVTEVRSLAMLLQAPVRAIAKAGGPAAMVGPERTPGIELSFAGPPAPAAKAGTEDGSRRGQADLQDAPEEESLAAGEVLKARIRAHDPEATACGALCGLLESAVDPIEYEHRRMLVLGAVQSPALGMKKVRAALADLLARETSAILLGDRTAFLLELAARVQDPGIARAAARLPRPPAHEVENLLRRIAEDAEAHGMLAFLARDPAPVFVQGPARAAFQKLVHSQAGGFQRWAKENPRGLLHKELLRGLLESNGTHAGPVLRELLLHGPREVRSRLVQCLAAVGTGAALRVLALGMPYDGSSRDPAVIRALGSFDDPLAIHLLREVLHRCNTARYCRVEAEAAVQALAASACPEAREFLLAICGRRKAGMGSFRGRIRRLVEETLQTVPGGAA